MTDLDDFFAKKDRKKAKGKKFTTTEEIAKKLEETGKKSDKPKQKFANLEGGDDTETREEEDEWKVFEEDEKKDYSGLKIGNLTVTEGVNNDADEDRSTGENNSDGESSEAGGKHTGPWKMSDRTAAPESKSASSSPSQQTLVSPPGTGGSSYRPPHLRNPQTTVERVSIAMGRSKKNVAPDINSEEYFPTLNKQSLNDTAGAWGRKKRDEGTFEEVRNRGGARVYSGPEAQTQAPKLSLGNKYGALTQDQS